MDNIVIIDTETVTQIGTWIHGLLIEITHSVLGPKEA